MLEVGFRERIIISGQKGQASLDAKIDTGAARTSVDMRLAAKVGAGPIVGTVLTKSALNRRRRILATVSIQIRGITYSIDAAIEDRSSLSYRVLVGRDVLEKGQLRVVLGS